MAKKPTGTPSGAEQLKSDLKAKTPGRFYVLYGEEDYLRRYYLEQLKKLLLDDLTADFNLHRLNGENFSVELFADCLEALPMMAERSMVLAEDVDLFAQADTERLCAMLSDLPEHCCLVLTYEEFKPDKRKRKLWEAIEKNAVLAEFRYQSESDLRAWIRRHFAHEKKMIAPELCGYLLQQCGLSMTRLDAEIGKICAYSGADTVVRADIDAVVFQLTDALALRHFDDALALLHTLLKLQNDPIPIVAAIGSQMRRLHAAKILLNEGKSAEELAQLCSMPPFAATKTMGQARRLSERFCSKAVELCCRTDYQLKTSYGDGERLAELLILQLAEETRHD